MRMWRQAAQKALLWHMTQEFEVAIDPHLAAYVCEETFPGHEAISEGSKKYPKGAIRWEQTITFANFSRNARHVLLAVEESKLR